MQTQKSCVGQTNKQSKAIKQTNMINEETDVITKEGRKWESQLQTQKSCVGQTNKQSKAIKQKT